MNESVQFHPVADVFPLITGAEFDALVDDVRASGLHIPIVLHPDGRILDGRNRYRACLAAGVAPRFETWAGDPGTEVGFVVSLNLTRRHLDSSQRAMVAARLATLPRGANQHASIDAPSQADAAELLNVSRPSVQRAREVIEHGVPELVQAVERGAVSVSLAEKITELPPEDQEAIADLAAQPETPKSEIVEEYKRRAHVANNSGNNEWYTPPAYLDAARDAMGSIDLDPASCEVANETVKAGTFYTAESDGLSKPWQGSVWMNPPYAQPLIAQFSEAVAEKFDSGEITQACVLVNNATETGWFQRMLQSSAAVCLLKGRVRFLDPEGNPSGAPLQGQAVLYLGGHVSRFVRAFGGLGHVLVKP
jgi:ParB-like chromosome segregation protein Spo0J